jgi:hypothetical protein
MLKGYLVGGIDPFTLFPADGGDDWPGQLDIQINPVMGKKLKDLAYWELDAWDVDLKMVEKLQKKVNVKVNMVKKPVDLDFWGFGAFVLRQDDRTGEVYVWKVEVK